MSSTSNSAQPADSASVVAEQTTTQSSIHNPYFYGLRYAFSTSWGLALASCISMFVSASLPALNVWAIQYVSKALEMQDSLLIPGIILVVNFAIGIFYLTLTVFFDDRLRIRIAQRANLEFNQVLAHVPTRSFLQTPFLELTRGGRNAIKENSMMSNFKANRSVLSAIVSSVTLGMALWNIHHVVAIIAIFTPLPVIINSQVRARFSPKFWRKQTELQRHMLYFLNQLVYQRQGQELATLHATQTIADKTAEYSSAAVQNFVRNERFFAFMEFLFGLVTLGSYVVCVYLLSQDLVLATLVAAVSGLTSYVESLRWFNQNLKELVDSLEPNRKFQEFLASAQDYRPYLELPAAPSMQFADVNVHYGDFHAVKGMNLELQLGGFTALVGMNGCGKTSFLKAIMGTQPQATGTVRVGEYRNELNNADYMLPFIAVQQEYGRYEVSVREYLALGLNYQPTDEQLWHALAQVQLDSVVRAFPQGLDNQLGEQWAGGTNVSGGQWQRMAIARCFLARTPLVYFDEPTSAIDAAAEEAIFAEISQLSQERFVLLTTHRVSTLQNASRIYVMREGSLVEQGTFAELNRPGTYFHELFESQLVS